MKVNSAAIDTSTNGDNAIVAGVAGAIIRVVGYVLMAGGTVNVKWMSDTGGSATELSGPLPLTAQAGAVAPHTPRGVGGRIDGWFDTVAGKALNLNLSAGQQVSGHVSYVILPQ